IASTCATASPCPAPRAGGSSSTSTVWSSSARTTAGGASSPACEVEGDVNPRAPSPEIVLVVDDDPGNLDSVQRILQREGLEVLAAASGEEALEILRKSEVRVIVTDLMMPGMTGTALLRAAKAISPHVEVVLMTAYGTV